MTWVKTKSGLPAGNGYSDRIADEVRSIYEEYIKLDPSDLEGLLSLLDRSVKVTFDCGNLFSLAQEESTELTASGRSFILQYAKALVDGDNSCLRTTLDTWFTLLCVDEDSVFKSPNWTSEELDILANVTKLLGIINTSDHYAKETIMFTKRLSISKYFEYIRVWLG